MSDKIGIYEFNAMPLGEQADHLWEYGTFITNSNRDMKYQLYLLHDFYVEVAYKDEESRIIELKPFKTIRLLEPYLDELNIEDLI